MCLKQHFERVSSLPTYDIGGGGKRKLTFDTGTWQGKTTLGNDPQGKVLGILGMGGIGRVSISKQGS